MDLEHPPEWARFAAPNALIKRSEVLDWLKATPSELHALMEEAAFPQPRAVQQRTQTSAAHKFLWRVGDVRAWLSRDPERLAHELAKPVHQLNPMQLQRPRLTSMRGTNAFKPYKPKE